MFITQMSQLFSCMGEGSQTHHVPPCPRELCEPVPPSPLSPSWRHSVTATLGRTIMALHEGKALAEISK